jgi:hypothetical protein
LSGKFDERLNECLEAISSGQRTLEECLAMYPDDAERLEPALRTAMLLSSVLAAQPRREFATSARERFLRVTGSRLQESLSFEPRSSFVMAARQRFLAAAQRMMQERKPSPWSRWRPAFRVAQFASAAATVFVLGFGSFAVTTSADALPGEWRYPVKRTVEDIRYTFTFGDGARRGLDIKYTQERLNEIEKMAALGRPIGEGPLKDLKSQTDSLVTRLDSSELHGRDAEIVAELGKKQLDVLKEAEPLVAPKAADELEQAKGTSTEVYVKAAQVVIADQEQEEAGPTVSASPLPTVAPTEIPPTTATTEEPAPTEEAATPEPSVPEITPIPGVVIIVPVENDTDAGVTWQLVVVDRFSMQVPSESSGWRFVGLTIGPDGTATAPSDGAMLRIINSDSTAIIVIAPRTGDVYWEQYYGGMFHEFKVRSVDGPIIWQASEESLNEFYPGNAAIVLHILNSIQIQPPPTPTPEPSATPKIAPEGTDVSGSGATPTPSP